MFAVDWSEWVVRLPGSEGSPVWTIILLLGAGILLYALANFLGKIAERAHSWISPAVTFLVFILAIYALNYLFGSDEVEPSGPIVTVTIGADDCEAQLVDRCPTQDSVVVGGTVLDTIPAAPTVTVPTSPVPTTG